METMREAKIEQRTRWQPTLTNALARVSFVVVITFFTALRSQAYSYYSGASVGSDGTVYGWGVTDATPPPGMYHTAYVYTTLTSPKGRVADYGWVSAPSTVREDVSLPFDPTDLGTYVVSSLSSGFCHTCGCWWFQNFPSGASETNAPARLVPYNYPPCAPNGVGPLQVLNNGSVVNCAGNQKVSAFDGVARNLMYQLVDGTGAAYPGAYTIAESFSNFQKTPSNSGLGQPTATNADIPAGGLLADTQYAGYPYPATLGSNEHSSYTQNFSVTIGGTAKYPLTTTVSISLGNFNGTPEDNVTITTP
jgi:hypothetical protein